ncbi:hypothetical protein OIU77_007079 [Salix suchowensis]|uniref:Secreted protein n=1 Tax=Salix suchowensis TaxID=1278906 RepID=A0ABQ9APW9_9ROSI|nr:hypothetical protein OIU77_007079 [Salix suchowensis]
MFLIHLDVFFGILASSTHIFSSRINREHQKSGDKNAILRQSERVYYYKTKPPLTSTPASSISSRF